MLEAHSPLGVAARFERKGVVLSEASDFTLTQVAGDEKHLKKALEKLPEHVGTVFKTAQKSVLRIGPRQCWVLGEVPVATEHLFVTPLSSSRTRLQLQGPTSRSVLAACAMVDFSPEKFKPGQFVMTGIHHTPVTIQCIDEDVFHVFALRTFALNVWEWLCDIAEGF